MRPPSRFAALKEGKMGHRGSVLDVIELWPDDAERFKDSFNE